MNVNKYRTLFVAETREHLEALALQLVELESVSVEAAAPLVDEIFRHIHSVKGMAASMGYDPICTLAHRMEDVVAAARRVPPPPPIIDLLLRGVDALGTQVDAIDAEAPLEEQPELLRLLREATLQPRPAPSPPQAAPSRWVVVRLSETAVAPEVRAFIVHRRLSELTTIAESQPSLDMIKAGALSSLELRFRVDVAFEEATCRERLSALPDVAAVEIEPLEAPAPARESKPRAEAAVSGAGAGTVRVATGVLDDLIDTVGELFIARARLENLMTDAGPEVEAALDNLAARVREIHSQVMAVRMMPLRTLTDRYPRLVRDLGRSLGKEVTLQVEGGDIELDRAILDNLDPVFVHVLRNAVDHGLESTSERLERGKAREGRVLITASRDRDAVVVSIGDNGRGLDPEALVEMAVAKNLITRDESEAMSAREAYFLICAPGFSTKQVVSDISGRGVGMDAVRDTIEGLGGSLDITSELGGGTQITFRLPLTLAIIPVLMVEVVGRTFAIPATKVVAVREPGDDIFEQAGGNVYLSFQHALVRVTALGDMLGLSRHSRMENVVVLEDGRDLYAVSVDGIRGYQEVVVKPLGEPLDRLDVFSGATVLGDGQPVLILDLLRALRVRAAA